MLMPSIFGENLFDDFFGDFPFYYDKDMKNVEKKLYGRKASHVMKTDIKETDNGYELVVDKTSKWQQIVADNKVLQIQDCASSSKWCDTAPYIIAKHAWHRKNQYTDQIDQNRLFAIPSFQIHSKRNDIFKNGDNRR